MFGPIRAVIVDDTPSHLINISSGLSAAGIPCTPYWYDREEIGVAREKLKPAPPAGGHRCLRIIFTDLNLEESAGSLAERIGPVINVISELVAKDGGAYIVVFWTVMGYSIDEIREELNRRLPAVGVSLPIAVDEIEKEKFVVDPSDDLKGKAVLASLFKERYDNLDTLKDEVLRVVGKHGLLHMLAEWESRATGAAAVSTNNLYHVAKQSDPDGVDVTEAMRRVCSIIAAEAAGIAVAAADPARAFDLAMQGILVDSFGQSVNDETYATLVESELRERLSKVEPIKEKREEIYSYLNTLFHIDNEVAHVTATDRGAVIHLDDARKKGVPISLEHFCCWDDFFWEPDKRERKNQIKRFSESLDWVLMEVGASCDHAQGKSRSLRYLVAVQLSPEFVKIFVTRGKKAELRNEALRLLGPYHRGGDIFYLLVSLRRFVSWQVPEIVPTIEVLYRMRTSIVDYLLNHYSTWSMRPGITEFRSGLR